MFNKDKALQQLKKAFNNSPVRVALATVLSCEEETYTVQFVDSDLVLPGVRPMVIGPSERKLVALPQLGSVVMVTNSPGEKVSLKGLAMMWITHIETLLLVSGEQVAVLSSDAIEGVLTAQNPPRQ